VIILSLVDPMGSWQIAGNKKSTTILPRTVHLPVIIILPRLFSNGATAFLGEGKHTGGNLDKSDALQREVLQSVAD